MKILNIAIKKLLILLLVFWVDIINIRNAKYLKKIDKELLSVAWHPTRVENCYMLEDGKKT